MRIQIKKEKERKITRNLECNIMTEDNITVIYVPAHLLCWSVPILSEELASNKACYASSH